MPPLPHDLPHGATDTHVHVFDPAASYPPDAGYRPTTQEIATAADLKGMLAAAGLSRAVLVQPSGYGTDNSVLLRALKTGRGAWAGIAVLGPDATADTMRGLARHGVVGLRVNLQQSHAIFDTGPGRDPLAALAETANRAGLSIHVQARYRDLPDLLPRLLPAGCVVLDHLGFPDPDTDDPALLTRLATEPRLHVKLSGAFRLSKLDPPYKDLSPFVQSAIRAFGPDRCLWGSDWPFVNAASRPRHGETVQLLKHWVPDPEARRIILSETPARLYFQGKAI